MPEGYFVHESAIVDEGAWIGAGSKVWHFSHVMGSATLGERVIVGQNCFIGPNVQIGDGCKLQNNISVYERVTLEEDVFCGPSMVFTNVINPRAFIERKTEFLETLVKRGATLGANSTILCGVNIGEHAMIGAGATVTKDVPDYALVVGIPAKQIGWVSRAGLTLGDNLVCPESAEEYELVDGALRLKGAANA
ncbi:MAG: N-acetyltransferase [Planctomycetes bacterium]|nr:N-acetyltransferase [Planctomycetota bacterium]